MMAELQEWLQQVLMIPAATRLLTLKNFFVVSTAPTQNLMSQSSRVNQVGSLRLARNFDKSKTLVPQDYQQFTSADPNEMLTFDNKVELSASVVETIKDPVYTSSLVGPSYLPSDYPQQEDEDDDPFAL
jgi:hypothetical protein